MNVNSITNEIINYLKDSDSTSEIDAKYLLLRAKFDEAYVTIKDKQKESAITG